MGARLNHLFQTSPRQFLERTVVFSDALPANKLTHFVDFEPIGPRAKIRAMAGQHLYQDAPLVGYFLPPGGFVLIPKENPPHRFVFLPEFTGCRLLAASDGPKWLKLQLEENLMGPVPPPEAKFLDSFAYWDQIKGQQLVGVIRATTILVKEQDEPWTVYMQLIVGPAGYELVHRVFSRPLTTA